jgi:hypothetical protein
VVLWDLSDRAVGGRQNGDDLGERARTDLRAAIGARNRDGEKACIGKNVQFLMWQGAVAVALDRLLGDPRSDFPRGAKDFRIRAQTDGLPRSRRRHSETARRQLSGRRIGGWHEGHDSPLAA